ncbi:hypothetical protein EV383_4339 [Pseudonocardia sediminis]|uniref:Uncharacterized protein n=1 Tax=Pseudonocardia sediminis TaxID=1397368 RepID=A0A4Q7UZJ7_PSEST|nr:hypothetical protein [Pseudonocardia sediminis]RZT87416.1 hypothetical protein EV383_4339 [Pseudonocardia sediminis]
MTGYIWPTWADLLPLAWMAAAALVFVVVYAVVAEIVCNVQFRRYRRERAEPLMRMLDALVEQAREQEAS